MSSVNHTVHTCSLGQSHEGQANPHFGSGNVKSTWINHSCYLNWDYSDKNKWSPRSSEIAILRYSMANSQLAAMTAVLE